MKRIIAVLSVLVLAAATAGAQELIPEIKLGDAKLTIKGFAQCTYVQNVDPAADGNFAWTTLRTKLTLTWEKFDLRTEVNFAELQYPKENWLRELNLGYSFSDDWRLSVGRVFLPVGYATPPAFKLQTVNYPTADPFKDYATGLMLEGKLKGDWSLMAAVTGASGLSFDDAGCWQKPEFSARVEKKVGTGSVAGDLQLSSSVCRVATDFTWQATKDFTVRGELSYVDSYSYKCSNRVGGYLFAAYKPLGWLELHSQVDSTDEIQKSYYYWQRNKAKDGTVSVKRVEAFTSDVTNVIWLTGVRLIAPKDQFSFTVDYEVTVDGKLPDRLLARAQFRL